MSNLLIPGIFAAGCITGMLLGSIDVTLPDLHNISLYVLYALMLQVGFSIGCSDDCSKILRTMRPKYLLIPAANRCWHSHILSCRGAYVEPMERGRLPCSGLRHGLLLTVVDIDSAIENSVDGCATCHRTRHHCPACQHIPRIVCLDGCPHIPSLLRQIGSDFSSRSDISRCCSAHNHAYLGQ